jgi:poly(3-hydroxybutyrate) depolymerase
MTPCTTQGAVNLVHLHGEQDMVVPFEGGSIAGIAFPPVAGTLDAWAAAHECAAAETDMWTCRNGTIARLVSDAAWGHEWQSTWTRTLLETFFLGVS